MKTGTKIIVIIFVIILTIGGIFSYFIFKDLKQEELLKNEIENITTLDITKDEIDMTIKTQGNYAILEKTIKTYLNDYGNISKEVLKKISDNNLSELLTLENIKKDAPEFIESEKTIVKLREVTKEVDEIIKMADKEYIMSLIKKYELSDYYIDLYSNLMFDEKTTSDVYGVKKQLNAANKKLKSLSVSYENAIKFLKMNKGKWEISGNQLYFYDKALADQYNKIVAEI